MEKHKLSHMELLYCSNIAEKLIQERDSSRQQQMVIFSRYISTPNIINSSSIINNTDARIWLVHGIIMTMIRLLLQGASSLGCGRDLEVGNIILTREPINFINPDMKVKVQLTGVDSETLNRTNNKT